MTPAVHNTVSQGMLAKLLATENITVHVGNYSTAFFDVKNRILGLPTWNVKSKHVSDLLIGHEVGHALWTPENGIEKFKSAHPEIPFAILNIVEDIRIERMIQSRYPGLIASFNCGYAEFLKNDFFKIAGQDVNELGFADRLNIKSKLSNLISVKFSAAETIIFDRCKSAETFEDVIEIVKDIYEMIKHEPKIPPQKSSEPKKSPGNNPTPNIDEHPPSESDEGSSNDDATTKLSDNKTDDDSDADHVDSPDDNNTKDLEEPGGEDIPDESGETSSPYGSAEEELNSQTESNLNSELEKMQETYTNHIIPLLPPSPEHINRVVTTVRTVIASRMSWPQYADYMNDPSAVEDWLSYKKSVRRHIKCLITDFERKKAAFQYSRAQTSDTGEIDVNRLHQYKFEDQIFSSVTRLADCKNHGMMFFIDYSGSMAYDMCNVLDHTMNLVMFCDAVKIPFRVFGFTTPAYSQLIKPSLSIEEIPSNQLSIAGTNIIELLSSELKPKELELALRQMRAQRFFGARGFSWFTPRSEWEELGGTPLSQTLVVAHTLVKQFRKKYHIQKMHVIVLTDGEGAGIGRGYDETNNKYIKATCDQRFAQRFSVNLSGRDIELSSSAKTSSALIKSLREDLGCIVIGFFINRRTKEIKSSAISSLLHSNSNKHDWSTACALVEKQMKQLRADNCMFIPEGFNYNCYFLINGNNAAIDDSETFSSELDDNSFSADKISAANRHKLAREFTKFSSNRKRSRVILAKFAELIA